MTAFIDPKTVPQRKLYSGEFMPGIGMGTFGSDRFTVRRYMAMKIRSAACSRQLLIKEP